MIDIFFMFLLRSCLLNWSQSISMCFLWHFHPIAVKPKKELISIIQWSDLICKISHHLSYKDIAWKENPHQFYFLMWYFKSCIHTLCGKSHICVNFYCSLFVLKNSVNHHVKKNSLLPNDIYSTLISFLTYLGVALAATDFFP